ncbi:MAG TPA: SDR family oxidoreductase [Polyangiaceae bacterium]|jgi:NAD(P)-dependent dehydrogenase (short-subunit alcohol dehydrogenase family)|nr:SDR family oxidoreductase [Polyangiaceae bacterium]
MNLKDKTVLVTGASRGLGAALAQALGRKGARVVLVARGEQELEAVADGIRREGGTAVAIPGDLGDKTDIHRVAGIAAATSGPVDVVFHNASTLGKTPLRPLLDTDCEDLERVLAVNLVGPFRLTKVLAGSMALCGAGLVVHVTSDASVNAYPTWGAYSVSKAALDHLGRVLGAELAELGVKVLSVDPGEMRTQMHADAIPDADPATLADPDDVARRLVSIVEHSATLVTGARLEASTWSVA